MTREQAEGFYAVHKERPFFNDLCTFMTSGPVVVQVLEGEDAVARNREVMGATNPETPTKGRSARTYAESIEANSVHGSDSDENAKIEIDFFFKPEEIVGYSFRAGAAGGAVAPPDRLAAIGQRDFRIRPRGSACSARAAGNRWRHLRR